MSDFITVTIDDRKLLATLRQLRRKVENMDPVMREISQIMLAAVKENFNKEGRPDKWKPLAPSTLRQLAKKGRTGKMLNRTGAGLWHSIEASSTADRASVGTNKEYAPFLHFGTRRMPARPYMMIQRDDRSRIENILKRHLES